MAGVLLKMYLLAYKIVRIVFEINFQIKISLELNRYCIDDKMPVMAKPNSSYTCYQYHILPFKMQIDPYSIIFKLKC